jgi:uncharacterized phage protein (TIGR02220 family)
VHARKLNEAFAINKHALMSKSKRKAFNFFLSYYEIGKELNDKDRLQFYDAILKKQFENIDTELTGMAKFAYISQSHSIYSQTKGYFDKTKDPMFDPTVGGTQGCMVAPTVQVQEKEKEQVQHVKADIIDFDALILFINKTFGRSFKKVSPTVKSKYNARLKEGFTKEDFKTAITNCSKLQFHIDNNFQYCTPEYFSRSEILDKYSDVTKQEEEKIFDPRVEAMKQALILSNSQAQ